MPQQPLVPPITIMLAARPRVISARSICRGHRFDDATLATLREIVAAEPGLTFVVEDGAVQVGGLDEASLDRAVDAFRSRCEAPVAIGAPQVGYVEAALKTVEKD